MILLEQKNLLTKKKDKRGVGIPVMLVQALEYQYTACQRGTAGRSTKSVALGAMGLCGQWDGRSLLPPTASWKLGSSPLLATQHLSFQNTKCFIFLQA